MIKLLLQYGADVNISTRQWGSPLFFAVHETRASVEVVETLIKCGADLHTRGVLGETVLQRAIEQNRTDLVDLLIRYGICVGIRDHAGRTPLHAAVDLLYEKDYTFDVSLLRYTRGPIGDIPGQRRAPFRPRNYNGFPLASIKSLLQHGANTNVLSADGLTPLQIVAGFPHLKSNATPLILIKTLLRHGADINAHDTRHNTPLRLAVSVGNIRVAMALLAYGANIECPARQLEGYKTAIDLAKESEFRTKELRQLIVQMLAYIANFPLDARLEAAYAPGTKGWWEQLLNEEKFLDRPYLRHIFTRTPRTQPPPRTQMLVCVQWRASSESESPRHPRPGMDVSDLDSDSSGEQDTVQE